MQKQPGTIGGTWPALNDLPVLERAAADSQVMLAGRRVLVAASARDGVHGVLVHPDRVLSNMQTGVASQLSRTPAALVRRIHVEHTEVVEHVCASGTEAAVLWCWRADDSVDVEFSWEIPAAGAHGDTPGVIAEGATLRADYGNGTSVGFTFSEAAAWSVTPLPSATLRVDARLHLPQERDVWLAMAAARPEEALDQLLHRLRDAARVPIARAAAFRKRSREHLSITVSDPSIARSVLARIDQIESSLVEMPRGAAPISEAPHNLDAPAIVDALDACVIASAAAALGDATIPRATLRFLHASRTPDALVPAHCFSNGACSEPSSAATAAWISLAATFHAWSGDDGLLREIWPDLVSSARLLPPDRFGHVLRALAVTAESMGDNTTASDFRRAPATEAPPPWRSGSHARANVRAAHHLLKLIHKHFGLEPDAPRGRLRARLALPARWRHLRIDNIRVGDARVSILAEQDASQTRFRAMPAAGAIPIRLILEPALHRVPHRITIDGAPAQLDLLPHGNRVIAPVQIELDNTRSITFSFED